MNTPRNFCLSRKNSSGVVRGIVLEATNLKIVVKIAEPEWKREVTASLEQIGDKWLLSEHADTDWQMIESPTEWDRCEIT